MRVHVHTCEHVGLMYSVPKVAHYCVNWFVCWSFRCSSL